METRGSVKDAMTVWSGPEVVFTELSLQWWTDDLSAERIACKQTVAIYWTGLIEDGMNILALEECAS